MTSIAVTASVCANASEAALLVASFMSNSLAHDPPKCERFGGRSCVFIRCARSALLGTTYRRANNAQATAFGFYSEHPTTSIRFDESPLSEYRPSQNRPAIRRQFGPRVAGLCTR